jgi:hypothetical protein
MVGLDANLEDGARSIERRYRCAIIFRHQPGILHDVCG